MRALDTDVNNSNFVPDFMAKSLDDIDFETLKRRGVRYVAFDADSTLVPYMGKVIDEKTRKFLMKQRHHFKDWVIASNRITNDLLPLGNSIEAKVIRAGWLVRKPHRAFFDKVVRHFGGKPQEIVMIGDKLFADIWGANRAGMTTVWVQKMGPDNPLDWLIRTRHWEKEILKRYHKA